MPRLTQGTILGRDNNKKQQESHEVNPFSAGDHKAAWNRQDSITKTDMKSC